MQLATSFGPPRMALALCLATASLACALLVPPAWRSRIDIPLYGPIDGRNRSPRALETDPLPPAERRAQRERLLEEIERDRRELMNLVADPAASDRSPADDPELCRIIERLPELQDQLEAARSTPDGDAPDASVPR